MRLWGQRPGGDHEWHALEGVPADAVVRPAGPNRNRSPHPNPNPIPNTNRNLSTNPEPEPNPNPNTNPSPIPGPELSRIERILRGGAAHASDSSADEDD